jgi:hypothetical protein
VVSTEAEKQAPREAAAGAGEGDERSRRARRVERARPHERDVQRVRERGGGEVRREVGLAREAAARCGARLLGGRDRLVAQERRVREHEVAGRPGDGERVGAGDRRRSAEESEPRAPGPHRERCDVEPEEGRAGAGARGRGERRREERSPATGRVEDAHALERARQGRGGRRLTEEHRERLRLRDATAHGHAGEAEGGEEASLRGGGEHRATGAAERGCRERVEERPVELAGGGRALVADVEGGERSGPRPGEACLRRVELRGWGEVRERLGGAREERSIHQRDDEEITPPSSRSPAPSRCGGSARGPAGS